MLSYSEPPTRDRVDPTISDADIQDVYCLLNDLNLDALIAGVEEEAEPHPPAAEVEIDSTPTAGADRRAAQRLTLDDLGREVRLTIPGAAQTALVNNLRNGCPCRNHAPPVSRKNDGRVRPAERGAAVNARDDHSLDPSFPGAGAGLSDRTALRQSSTTPGVTP